MFAKEIATEVSQSLLSAARALYESEEWGNATSNQAREQLLNRFLEACANNLATGWQGRLSDSDGIEALVHRQFNHGVAAGLRRSADLMSSVTAAMTLAIADLISVSVKP